MKNPESGQADHSALPVELIEDIANEVLEDVEKLISPESENYKKILKLVAKDNINNLTYWLNKSIYQDVWSLLNNKISKNDK